MYKVYFRSDLTHICNLPNINLVQAQFQFNFKHHSSIFSPIYSKKSTFEQEVQIPIEIQNFTVQINIRTYKDSILQKHDFYISEQLTLTPQQNELLLAENLNLFLEITQSFPQIQLLAFPNIILQLPEFSTPLIFQLQTPQYATETPLTFNQQTNQYTINTSLSIPFNSTFRAIIFSAPKQNFRCKICSFSVDLIPKSQLLTLKISLIFAPETVKFCDNSQSFASFGLVENDGFNEIFTPKKLKKVKKEEFPAIIRLLINATNPLTTFNIAKIDNFGVEKLQNSQLLYNFEYSEQLQNSYLQLQTDENKVSNKIHKVSNLEHIKISSLDCENVAAFYRSGNTFFSTIPQHHKIDSTPLNFRLETVLSTPLAIVVVLNERQFFKLPINLRDYRESVVSSVLNDSQYKIVLEVKFGEVALDLVFNFQIFDLELKAHILEQNRLLLQQKAEIEQIEKEKNQDIQEMQNAVNELNQIENSEKKRKKRRVRKVKAGGAEEEMDSAPNWTD